MNIYPTFWQHRTAKTLIKRFLLYSNRPREGSVRLHAIAVSRVLSTEHDKSAVFQPSRPHYNLSVVIHQKGPSLSQKTELLKEFLGILDISKRILELFSGKFRDELGHISAIAPMHDYVRRVNFTNKPRL